MQFPYVQVGSSFRPMLPIVLRNGADYVAIEALVDSGSALNLIDEEYAILIGIQDVKEDGIEVEVEGIGGGVKTGYRHDVTIEFCGSSIQTNVVFLKNMSDQLKAILGQEGFFDIAHVEFEYSRKIFKIEANN